MAELFNIMKITVGPKKLTARVLVNPGMPMRTAEDIEATARVYYLAPAIAQHACLGDAGEHFQDCMADTEVVHLLEHLTVEIMNQTGLAGEVVAGRTMPVPVDERLFDVELSCPDDALTVGALSSAVFMMQWAFLNGDTPAPDFAGTVEALRHLALSLRGETGAAGEAPGDDPSDTEDGAAGAAAAAEPGEAGHPDGADDLPAAAGDGKIDAEAAEALEHEADLDAAFGGAAEERGAE